MNQSAAVEATGLVKAYGKVGVLHGIDLRVEAGSVFALLGPNGAGKTTAVRILATLTTADAGHARVAGYDIVRERTQVRRSISLTGQFAAIDEKQTGEENLRMMGRLSGLSRPAATQRAAELLERFGLTDAARRRTVTYSGGCAAASTSPPGSSAGPKWSSSTSRRPASTRAAAPSCGRWCANCPPGARRCS